jgi:hypothetical protein
MTVLLVTGLWVFVKIAVQVSSDRQDTIKIRQKELQVKDAAATTLDVCLMMQTNSVTGVNPKYQIGSPTLYHRRYKVDWIVSTVRIRSCIFNGRLMHF